MLLAASKVATPTSSIRLFMHPWMLSLRLKVVKDKKKRYYPSSRREEKRNTYMIRVETVVRPNQRQEIDSLLRPKQFHMIVQKPLIWLNYLIPVYLFNIPITGSFGRKNSSLFSIKSLISAVILLWYFFSLVGLAKTIGIIVQEA